ncbi:MAG: hypothetical protein LBQ54_11540 [Planctomycetaceae bacterium]|jgi:hypothetical protein|nr:hypothetical protein [Planctomycetaceae bacterium]
MGLFTSKKHSRIAVFLHDGDRWSAFVFAYSRRNWRSIARTSYSGKNPRQIPGELLDFAEKNGACRVRVVLPRNIQTLDQIELPVDATDEEIHTAVMFAHSSETDQTFGTVRIASSLAGSFQMGGSSETLLLAEFETPLLEQYEKNCRSVRIQFDGAGVLELASLGTVCRQHPESRFLFLRRETGFYAAGATEQLPMTAGGIGLGSVPEEHGREPERLQRAARRLETHRTVPLVVWSTPSLDSSRESQIRGICGENADVRFVDFADVAEEVAGEIAAAEHPGVPGGGGAFVGLGETGAVPYRAGTWMFFLTILFAGMFVLITMYKQQGELRTIHAKTKAWEVLQAERKKQNEKLSGFDSQRSRYEKIIGLLSEKSPVPKPLMTVLTVLDENMPLYTRLASIEQISDTELLITGYTMYQDGFLELQPALNKELQTMQMVAELKTLEKLPDSREQRFVFKIHAR